MRIQLPSIALLSATAAFEHGDHRWQRPCPTDRRSPCPMINALANQGYLPRTGLNVSLDQLVLGFDKAINLDPSATLLVGLAALPASSTGYNNTFNLDDLSKHNVIEHDGSLSRADIYTGDNYSFNRRIWASVTRFFTEEKISIETAASARAARLRDARRRNPEFNLTAVGMQFSRVETALYLVVFGDPVLGNADRGQVEYLFRKERLPTKLGWRRPDAPLTMEAVLAMAEKVGAVNVTGEGCW
ncbi:Chloroperoxidase [Elsinoe ampelina]|uniref:Chloroperoxidase n=1 Tax=Elsinoe ampelina TaxID=302913 RepID=A0A6A6FXR8_9PEZI|nr:Chloroperoxidase [Elsinoe ampelina]